MRVLKIRPLLLRGPVLLTACVLLVTVSACAGNDTSVSPIATFPIAETQSAAAVPDVPTVEPTATRFDVAVPIIEATEAAPAAAATGAALPPDILLTAESAWGEGGIYVASLPRPVDVPAGWLLDRPPRFEERSPDPGATYHFACQDLPARSTGVASVGYRSLEGLPSVGIEYVLYASANDARAALADMRSAAEACTEFTLAAVGSAEEVAVTMNLLPLDDFGDESFAVALTTSSDTAGELTTYVIKILQDNVVIGINHAVRSGEPLPESAVSDALSRLTVDSISAIQ